MCADLAYARDSNRQETHDTGTFGPGFCHSAIAIGHHRPIRCGSGTKFRACPPSKQTPHIAVGHDEQARRSRRHTAAAGPNKTLRVTSRKDHLTEVGPVQTRGDSGARRPSLAVPGPGGMTPETTPPGWAYGAIVSTNPAWPWIRLLSIRAGLQAEGTYDRAKILEFAPGEIKKLPGYTAPRRYPTNARGFECDPDRRITTRTASMRHPPKAGW